MKLDLKKMALIMVVGIFALSEAVFAADMEKEVQDMQRAFKELQINNETHRKVSVEVNGKKNEVTLGNKTIPVPQGRLKTLNIEVEGMREKIKAECAKITMIGGPEECKEKLLELVKQAIARGERTRGFNLTAEAKGDILEINVKKVPGTTEEKTNENPL